jgi:hypothetical protein
MEGRLVLTVGTFFASTRMAAWQSRNALYVSSTKGQHATNHPTTSIWQNWIYSLVVVGNSDSHFARDFLVARLHVIFESADPAAARFDRRARAAIH